MHAPFLKSALFFFCLLCLNSALAQEVSEEFAKASPLALPEATITKRVDEVNLVFTVTDSRGRLVSDLQRDSFTLMDNQKVPQHISYFQQQSDLPLRVALLIDLSDSVRSRFRFEQEAAIVFLKKILRPDRDKAFIVGFDSKVFLAQDTTNNMDKLATATRSLISGGDTAFYDALVFASDKLAQSSDHVATRRAIILISDGLDTRSQRTLEDAKDALMRSEAVMYALSTNSTLAEPHPKGDAILDTLVGPSGGRILAAREKTDLKQAFSHVAKTLRTQYAVGYRPEDLLPDGSYHAVNITVQKKGFQVRCRKGYFAPHTEAQRTQ
jgi:VWFA-related protein